MNASSHLALRIPGSSRTTASPREQWLERFRRSGLTQEGFARTHGLKLSTLRYWLYHPPRARPPAEPAPRWQEIRLNGWPTMPGWGAEISWADGRTVRLAAELARELVAPLLART
jgi:hypothetical protein